MKLVTARNIQAFVQQKVPKSKLFCGEGLFLHITDARTAKWRVKFRLEDKEKTYTIGDYPSISLSAARIELSKVKSLVKEGKNPVDDRRLTKAANITSGGNTFQSVATQWLAKKKAEWSDGHYKKSVRALERDIYPTLGNLPISQITSAMVASALEEIHNRGATESSIRINQHLSGIFKYAKAKGFASDNPATAAREVLPSKKKNGRMAAVTTWEGLGDILRKANAVNLSPSVRMAHRLLAFSSARIGNVVTAEWTEFDLDAEIPVWTIPRTKLKVKSRPIDLRLPLGEEIAQELKNWRKTIGGKGYTFPSPRGGGNPIGVESLEKAYRITLGLAKLHTPHGWRSAFSTLARDNGFAKDVVELTLDHAHESEVVRAYDRGERFKQRIELLQWWSKELTAIQNGAQIIQLKKASGKK